MSDIDISPLAKRLADENNVDWRILHGSGDNGRVVERDVLDYLARVMAGDEDLNPTPEPLPAGMESWTDQETFARSDSSWDRSEGDSGAATEDTLWADPDDDMLDQDASVGSADTSAVDDPEQRGLDRQEVDTDSDWYSASPDPAGDSLETDADSAAAEPAFELGSETEPASDADIDEDIFVFDDEPAASAPREKDDESGSWADDVAGFGESGRAGGESDFAGDDFFALGNEELTDPATGDGREFSWDEPEPAATDQAPVEPIEAEPSLPEPSAAADTLGSSQPDTPWEAAASQEQEQIDAQPADSLSGGSVAPWDSAAADYAEEATSASETSDFAGNLPEGVVLEEAQTRVADSAAAAAEAPYPSGGSAVATPAPSRAELSGPPPVARMRGFSGSGIVLRRDVDLTALLQAQQAVSHELGMAEVMAPASFLLRAAARAGRPWPLTTDDAAPSLATLSDDGVAVTYLPRASEMPFRELVAACNAAPGDADADASALVVADLSVLGIDEAVLDLGRPVLTLGRVLPQATGDRFRGTLALSGPVAPDAGSRFLARVVELLAAPVRLVI